MYQYIWENNKNHLSDIAIRYYGTKITYGKLFANIEKAAASFYAMGVRAGDIVTIMSLHTPETVVCIYALNYIGAVANMVYLTLSEKEILQTLETTKSKLFLVLDLALDRVDRIKNSISIPVVVLCLSDSFPTHLKIVYGLKKKPVKHDFLTWKGFIAKAGNLAPLADNHAATAVIVYTSGTTGEPKGVELSNDNINAIALQYRFVDAKIERGDTMLVFMPPFLSIGLCYLHMPMCHGVELIICADPDPQNVTAEFFKHKPNHYVTAPANALLVLSEPRQDLSFVKSFGAGGDSMSVEDENRLNQYLQDCACTVKYSAGYGMTEFSAVVTVNSNSARKIGTIGIPLVKCNVRITDLETHEEKKINEVGEMLFCTPSQMQGYINCEEENKKIIEDFGDGNKWIHTGDLGFVDEDGFVHYVGRIKRIYLTKIIGGDGTLYKIFPQRIEESIERLDDVKICGVVVRKDDIRLHIPTAYVVLSNESIKAENAIKTIWENVRGELPEQDWPESILILNTMPMTPSGKIDYQALEKLAEENNA